MIRDGDFHSQLPITGSHEPCGTVVEVGSEVKGFKKGDRIGTLPFMHPCGECPDCKFGSYIYCDKMEGAMGISTDGAFGEVSLLIYEKLRLLVLCLRSKVVRPFTRFALI